MPCANLSCIFFAPVPFYPHANLRHYTFLNQGIPDIALALSRRRIGFVLRRYPAHSLLQFCGEVDPALVVGDENPMREPESWRRSAAKKLRVPFWTVDADVVVPSRLLEKSQYAARTILTPFAALFLDYSDTFEQPHCTRPLHQASRFGRSAM